MAEVGQGDLGRLSARLSDRVVFRLLGGVPTLFDEAAQTIFELNDVAAWLCAKMVDSCRLADLQRDLVAQGLSSGDAGHQLLEYVFDGSRAGQLVVSPVEEDASESAGLTFDLAGRSIRLNVRGGSEASAVLHTFSHFSPASSAPKQLIDVVIMSNVAWIGSAGQGQLVRLQEVVPAIKGLLTTALLEEDTGSLFLHAATLLKQDRALLIAGEPGAGKTVLTLALVKRGFEFAGDDIVSLERGGNLIPVPFLPALKSAAWQLAAKAGWMTDAYVTHQRLDGVPVKYVPQRLPNPTPYSAGWIVVLRRGNRRKAECKKAEPSTVLSTLLAGAYGAQKMLKVGQFSVLADLVSQAQCLELTYHDANEAAAVLEHHCVSA